MISSSSVGRSITIVSRAVAGPLHTRGTTSDVLPSCTEASASAGEQTFLFFLAKVFVELLFVQARDAEQHDYEDNEEDSEESELRPEVDDAEEGEVDGDAVEEGAHRGRCADEVADGVVVALGARLDCAAVVAAVGLLVKTVAGAIAEGLCTEGGVLGCDDHGERVVEREHDEGEEDSSHEHSIWCSLALADPEEGDPEEANANGGHADNGRGKEEHGKEEVEDVVDREDTAGDGHDVVDRVEDLRVSEQETTVRAADRVLDLVDAGNQHAGEDEDGHEKEQQAANKLQRAEDSLELDPCADEEVVALAAVLGCKSLAAHQCALLTNKSFELTAIAGFQPALSTFSASLELPLTFAILVELAGSRSCKLWRRNSRRRLNERERQECKTRRSVAAVEDSTDGDKRANGKRQSALSVWELLVRVYLL